jgi:hypothetical protein
VIITILSMGYVTIAVTYYGYKMMFGFVGTFETPGEGG